MPVSPQYLTTASGQSYFINAMPADLAAACKRSDLLRFSAQINLFFRDKLTDPLQTVDELRGWFKPIKQPTKQQVRQAMLLTIDDDYSLKAGGGSASDELYSSSLRCLLAHPVTGLDYEPVILKKYSTCFDDVLITFSDIESLIGQTLTTHQMGQREADQVDGLLQMLHRGYRYQTISLVTKGGSQEVRFSPEHEQRLLDALTRPGRRSVAVDRTGYFAAIHTDRIDYVRQPGNGILNPKTLDAVCPIATAGYLQSQHRDVAVWERVRQQLVNIKNAPSGPGRLAQLCLF